MKLIYSTTDIFGRRFPDCVHCFNDQFGVLHFNQYHHPSRV